MLESLLNDEAHRLNRCPCLLAKLYHAICRIAVGKKIINEQDMVFIRKEAIADTYRIIPVLGKGMYHGGKLLSMVFGCFFLMNTTGSCRI